MRGACTVDVEGDEPNRVVFPERVSGLESRTIKAIVEQSWRPAVRTSTSTILYVVYCTVRVLYEYCTCSSAVLCLARRKCRFRVFVHIAVDVPSLERLRQLLFYRVGTVVVARGSSVQPLHLPLSAWVREGEGGAPAKPPTKCVCPIVRRASSVVERRRSSRIPRSLPCACQPGASSSVRIPFSTVQCSTRTVRVQYVYYDDFLRRS